VTSLPPVEPVPVLPDGRSAAVPDVTETVYLLFRRSTGSVVGQYSRQTVDAAEAAPQERDGILAMAAASGALQAIGVDQADIDAVVLDDPTLARDADLRVDPDTRRLVPLPRLTLTADRRELTGDGEDAVPIGISIVDADGNPLRDRSDTIRVITTRGKLSTQGGFVELRDGVGEITLRSVPETVPVVRVTASSPTGGCVQGTLQLEFS
jgi:hypothetical protein